MTAAGGARDGRARQVGCGGGVRPFGHSRDRSEVIEEEAVLLREAARRVIDGDGPVRIAPV